jgi:D-glycero-alpha-D-manno-heptose-7-phosphate kinase
VTTITATAPVRVCDAGGWTDTWFAARGTVCSIAVEPGARVVLELTDEPEPRPVLLDVELTGERYPLDEDGAARHPLLEAAVRRYPLPAGRGATIRVGAAVPPGSGVGTSAAVVVALVHALWSAREATATHDALALAHAAHGIEIGLGLQSGVQDQHASAHGGCNRIDIAYPHATVERIAVSDDVVAALDARLVTVYLGRPHRSSLVHEQVITTLDLARLEPLRAAAVNAAGALARGDLDAYGAALRDNTCAQAALHPDLVSTDAHALIEIARRHGAPGWKVNGAGGDGGSTTILAPHDDAARAAMLADIDAVPSWRRLHHRVAAEGARASVT